MPSSRVPRISVILPLYRSEDTLRTCLAALAAQNFRNFEVRLVDSSPGDACAGIAAHFPQFDYWHSPTRLWPQEARNQGVTRSTAEILVFSDPDCYAKPDWLERLLGTHEESGEPVVGALACYGRRWLDRGLHLTKFSKWLPGRRAATVDMGPTANLLCPRTLYASVGGFSGDMLMGDTSFSWALRGRGHRLRFAADAVVEHHHLDSFGGFVRERFRRGLLFGALRSSWEGGDRMRALGFMLASVLPLRLASNLAHTARHALQAGCGGAALLTAPLVATGHAASLLGESIAYARVAFARTKEAPAAPSPHATPRPRTG